MKPGKLYEHLPMYLPMCIYLKFTLFRCFYYRDKPGTQPVRPSLTLESESNQDEAERTRKKKDQPWIKNEGYRQRCTELASNLLRRRDCDHDVDRYVAMGHK